MHPLDLRRIPRNLPASEYKLGDEFAPFHPSASHVPPDYRDGWNRCWLAARAALSPLPAAPVQPGWMPTDEELTAIYKRANGEDTGKAKPLTVAALAHASKCKASKIMRAVNAPGDDVTLNQPLTLAQIGAALALATPAGEAVQQTDWQSACERLTERLREIGDYAHDHSTGPAVPDALWEVRRMAYEGEYLGVPTAPTPRQAVQPQPADKPCVRCNGTGVVSDGEIPSAFGNEPIKCFKDCPVCKGPQPADKQEGARMLNEQEMYEALTNAEPGMFRHFLAIQRKFCEVNGIRLATRPADTTGGEHG
jgi:hypothetical protein